jgi:hypothetical protein
MRCRIVLLIGGLLALSPPARAAAQGQDCELLPGAREAIRTIVGGEEVVHVRGPAKFVCPGEMILQADSAVGSPERGELELIGNVFFQDSVKTLTAAWARYVRLEARLVAREDVVLTDRKSESVVNGAELEYLPASENRTESEAIVHGRPHAIFHQKPKAEPAPADSAAQPLEIDADLMRIFGESRFLALGQVELRRGETRGYANEGEFDQEGQMMVLTGAARLEGEGYTLVGDRIEATLDGESLHQVVARRDAALEAEDLDLKAPELQIFFEAGEVHRLVAIRGTHEDLAPHGDPSTTPAHTSSADSTGGAAVPGLSRAPAESAAQPVVTSRDFRLTADSIDAIAPGQQLEVVIAVGRAFGVRAPDSLDIGLPESIAHDWIVGDTITGYFTREEAPVVDSTANGKGADKGAEESSETETRTVLERLVAVGEGGGARSLYRIREKGREADPPSANYIVADRITLVMSEGEVKDVEADGPIRGMHLQPEGVAARRPTAPGDSTGATAPVKPAGGSN